MKNVLLVLALAMSTGTFAQLEVEKKPETVTLYSNLAMTRLVEFKKDSTDSFYALYYKDAQYQHITVIKYLSLDNIAEVEQLLDLSDKVLETKEGFNTSKYSLMKTIGKNVLVINQEDSSRFFLNAKVITKMRESLTVKQ